MKQPKWQRARILKQNDGGRFVCVIGHAFWVQAKAPEPVWASEVTRGGNPIWSPPVFSSNLRADSLPVVFSPEFIELLPEFADDVELIPWEQFVRDCKENTNAR